MNPNTAKRFVATLAVGLLSAGSIFFTFASCNSVLGIDDAVQGLPVLTDTTTRASCDSYCGTVIANCTGAYAMYIDVAERTRVCQTACASAAWDDGDPGITNGNSLACRATHAVLAKADPATHCQAAGLAGGGVCGSACDGFCGATEPFCADDAFDASVTECQSGCAAFTYHTGPDASDIAEQGDDTLNCRIYHLQNAYRGDLLRTTHCPHTNVVSEPCPAADAG